jgi:hypothetical protein
MAILRYIERCLASLLVILVFRRGFSMERLLMITLDMLICYLLNYFTLIVWACYILVEELI